MSLKVYDKKTVLVTGAASGIGRALCKKLAGSGAVVFLSDVNSNAARTAAGSMAEGGGDVTAVALDVCDPCAFDKTISEIIKKYGRIDYIFNNAGICTTGEVKDLTLGHWKKTLDVNLTGVINAIQAVYPVMIQQGSGHIVNIASLAGLAPFPFNTPYTTSKYAVVGLTQSLAAEARRYGISVTLVCPGMVGTDFYHSVDYVGINGTHYRDSLPRRIMTPEKAAGIIASGVARCKKNIIFPFHTKVLWRIYQWMPWLYSILTDIMIRKFEKMR